MQSSFVLPFSCSLLPTMKSGSIPLLPTPYSAVPLWGLFQKKPGQFLANPFVAGDGVWEGRAVGRHGNIVCNLTLTSEDNCLNKRYDLMGSGHLQSNLWYHMSGGTKALIFGSKIKYEFRTKFSHPRPNQIWPWSAPEIRGEVGVNTVGSL